MKKKHVIILLIFAILLTIFLPLIIMWLYKLGKVCPIIRTPYTESDMLSYATAVIGAVVSATALIYSVVTNAIRFRISHSLYINDENEECILIRIYNDSPYECELESVSITNKFHNHSAHIIRRQPFSVKAKSAEEFPVTIEQLKKVIERFDKDKDANKLFYELRVGTGNAVYIKAEDLIKTIDRLDEHYKKYGISNTKRDPIRVKVAKKKK